MVRDSKGIMQFYLSPTHEPYLPLCRVTMCSITLCMFQSRPLRLYYSVYDGPEVPAPDDDFTERLFRSRDPAWPTDRQPPTSGPSSLPVSLDVKPTICLDVKPACSLEDFGANYFRSRNQTGCGRKQGRRRSSDGGIATAKRIKQEVTTDSHLYGGAGAPGDAIMTSPMTSPRSSLPVRPRSLQSGGTLSLPVTISKDFIKELVVSRALDKNNAEGQRCADSTVPGAADAATVQSSSDDTSHT